LVVDVDVAETPSDLLAELEDRFGALGGAIDVTSGPGQMVRIHGEVPCRL
jgi:hypothetical protein